MKLTPNWWDFKKKEYVNPLCWLMACACFAVSFYFCFSVESPVRKLLTDILKRREIHRKNPYQKIDALFQPLTGDGNLYVRFRDFNPDNYNHVAFMTRIYFRGSYTAYPTRLYVSGDGKVINNGQDVWQVNQEPTAELSKNLGISKLVIFEFDSETGELKSRTQSLTR